MCIYRYIYNILFFHLSSGLRRINMLVGISLTGGIGNQLEKKIKINNIHGDFIYTSEELARMFHLSHRN